MPCLRPSRQRSYQRCLHSQIPVARTLTADSPKTNVQFCFFLRPSTRRSQIGDLDHQTTRLKIRHSSISSSHHATDSKQPELFAAFHVFALKRPVQPSCTIFHLAKGGTLFDAALGDGGKDKGELQILNARAFADDAVRLCVRLIVAAYKNASAGNEGLAYCNGRLDDAAS